MKQKMKREAKHGKSMEISFCRLRLAPVAEQ
jgi:hypothetical protein